MVVVVVLLLLLLTLLLVPCFLASPTRSSSWGWVGGGSIVHVCNIHLYNFGRSDPLHPQVPKSFTRRKSILFASVV